MAGEAVEVAVKVSEQLGPAKRGSVKSEEAVARCEVYIIHLYTFIRLYRCSHHGQVYLVRNYIYAHTYIQRERERERKREREREREFLSFENLAQNLG